MEHDRDRLLRVIAEGGDRLGEEAGVGVSVDTHVFAHDGLLGDVEHGEKEGDEEADPVFPQAVGNQHGVVLLVEQETENVA